MIVKILLVIFCFASFANSFCVVSPSAYGVSHGNSFCPSYTGIKINGSYCGFVNYDNASISFYLDNYNHPEAFINQFLGEYQLLNAALTDSGYGGFTTDTWNCTSPIAEREECENSCIFSTSDEFSCTGDPGYCEYMPPGSNDTVYSCVGISADCFCASIGVCRALSANITTEGIIPTNNTTPYSTGVPLGTYILSCHNATFGIDLVSSVSPIANPVFADPVTTPSNTLEGVYVSMKGSQIIVTVEEVKPLSISLRKDTYFEYKDFNTSEYIIDLPPQVYIRNGLLYVTIFKDGAKIIETEFDIISEVTCRLHDCILCSHLAADWSCLPFKQKVLVAVVFLALFLATIIALPCCWYIGTFIWCWVIVPSGKAFCICLKCNKTRAAKRVTSLYNKMKDRANKELELEENLIPNQQYPRTEFRGGSMKLSGMTTLGLICVLCLIIPLEACDFGGTIQSTLKTCTSINTTTDNCFFQTTLLTSLPYPGSKNCFNIYDDQNNLLTSVSVLFTFQEETVALVKDYYTSDIETNTASIHQCYQAVSSCDGQKCEDFESSGAREPYNVFDDNELAVSWPGEAQCRRTGGFWGDGCLLASPACVYSSYSINPRGNYQIVYSPGQKTIKPAIQMLFYNAKGLTKTINLQATNNITTVSGVTFSILGNLVGTSTNFGTNKIIFSDGYYWLGPASLPQAPVLGSVGQIQADTLLKLKSAKPDAFIYAAGVVTWTENIKQNLYTFTKPPTVSTPQFKRFPLTLGAASWKVVNGVLKADNMNPGTLLVTIDIPNTLSVTRVKETICPKLVSVGSITGCYDCLIGSSLTILAKSDCKNGTVTVTTDDEGVQIYTNHISLSTTTENYTINFMPSESHNNFELCLNYLDTSSCAQIVFDAVEDTTITDRITQKVNNTDVPRDGSLPDSALNFLDFFTDTIPGFLEDIISGAAGWLKYIIFFAVLILMFVLVIWIVPKMWNKCKNDIRTARERRNNYVKIESGKFK